ncbi:MAG: ATP-binding protein [Thalassolituus sp.]
MKLRTQLFLLIAVLCLLMAVSATAFFRLSIERGFSQYLEDSEPPFLDTLTTALENHHIRYGSWDAVVAQWPEFVKHYTSPGGPPQSDFKPSAPPVFLPESARSGAASSEPAPSEQRGGFPQGGPGLPLFLLDVNRQLLAGIERAEPGTLLTPLRTDGTLIGWLGLGPRPEEAALRNQSFLDDQWGNLILIIIVVLGLALLVGWRMSRLWLRRVDDVMDGMQHFSEGNYQHRTHVAGKDELALLSQRLNDLGSTLQAGRSARERWMADMSHELRTPLSVLRSQLEAMQDGIRPLSAESVDTLHQQVVRMTHLVGDLHELALADAGAMSYAKQPLDILAWLKGEITDWRPVAEASGLSISVDLPSATEIMVLADEHRLHQLLLNLLSNSQKYTDRPGVLRLSLCQQNSELTLTVEDSAPGMPDDELEQLFEPLFRGEASRGRETGGSGLGLSIARRIAEAHDGTLTASASPLGGLSMILTLPLVSGRKA